MSACLGPLPSRDRQEFSIVLLVPPSKPSCDHRFGRWRRPTSPQADFSSRSPDCPKIVKGSRHPRHPPRSCAFFSMADSGRPGSLQWTIGHSRSCCAPPANGMLPLSPKDPGKGVLSRRRSCGEDLSHNFHCFFFVLFFLSC